MSYIFIDTDEARRCAALIKSKADGLHELLGGEPDERSQRVKDFQGKLEALSADLLAVTEEYAAMDEKMKALHILTQQERSGNNG